MGLDMRLSARKFSAKFDEEQKKNLSSEFPELNGLTVDEVLVELGCWRKANAIHNWFVQNVQGGADNQIKHIVSNRKLEDLQNACLRTLENSAEAHNILPTKDGFFFGSTEYDEDYFECVKYSLNVVETALRLERAGWLIEYNSSW
jgi:hypothetical protein